VIPPSKRLSAVAAIGAASAMLALAAGCATDPPAGTDDAGASTTADSAAGATDATTTTTDAAVAHDAATGVVDAGAVDASRACVDYCTCLATNCPAKTIPGGCLTACSAQTKWDLTCRTGMCNVAKLEPNNNHCDHAVGVAECLDKP
jgi:hypothetical protein